MSLLVWYFLQRIWQITDIFFLILCNEDVNYYMLCPIFENIFKNQLLYLIQSLKFVLFK